MLEAHAGGVSKHTAPTATTTAPAATAAASASAFPAPAATAPASAASAPASAATAATSSVPAVAATAPALPFAAASVPASPAVANTSFTASPASATSAPAAATTAPAAAATAPASLVPAPPASPAAALASPAAAPASPAAPAAPPTPDQPAERDGVRLQAKLSAGLYAASEEDYRLLHSDDGRRIAQHLSQRSRPGHLGEGYLATGWLTLMPCHRRIEATTFRAGLADYLCLADPSMPPTDPVTCRCGQALDPVGGAFHHLWACDKLHSFKTPLHDHMARAMHPILAKLPGRPRINKQPRLGQGAGPAQILDTIVDRVSGIRNLAPGGRLLFDYTVRNPSCKTYIAAGAAKIPLTAAKAGAKEKCRTYKDNIQPADLLYTPVFEPHGGVDPATVRMLEAFANAIVDSQAEGTGNRRRRREAYLCVWRAHLSVELMEGRVRWRQHQLDQLVNPECEEHLKGLKQHWVNQVAQRQSRRLWTGAARDDG